MKPSETICPEDTVRDKASGCGLLYPDAFAEERLVFVPPAATALLVLFSRNHNVRMLTIHGVINMLTDI